MPKHTYGCDNSFMLKYLKISSKKFIDKFTFKTVRQLDLWSGIQVQTIASLSMYDECWTYIVHIGRIFKFLLHVISKLICSKGKLCKIK